MTELIFFVLCIVVGVGICFIFNFPMLVGLIGGFIIGALITS